jgi:hypothetical protein
MSIMDDPLMIKSNRVSDCCLTSSEPFVAISWHEQVTFVVMMMSALYYTNIF